MSAHDPHRCGEDVAAYALGALEPGEAERMRVHLESCAVCDAELAAFRQVVDDIAISPLRLTAPPALRRGVLRAVADEPRLDSEARRGRRERRFSFALPRFTPAFAGGFAVVVAAVVVAVIALSSGGGGTSSREVAAQVTGVGSASLRLSGGHAQLVVRRFPSPPRGKIYEVWLQRPGGKPMPTTALFGVTASGAGDVDVPGSLHGVRHVLVTAEPAGGSRVPTSSPVIDARL